MPVAAPKPCAHCGVLVRDGSSRCKAHKVQAGSFADRRRGTRHERGYGREWDVTRERILARDKGLCQCCLKAGRATLAREVDHIQPRAEGGTDEDANLQAICRPCHQAKTAAESARGRAPQISTAAGLRTDRSARFLRARVSGVGGGAQ